MRQHENKTSALDLKSDILMLLLRHGLPMEQAHLAAHDVIGTFARSEVVHPCWAADVLRLPHDDEEEEEVIDKTGENGEPSARLVGSITIDKDGETTVDAEGVPPEVMAVLKRLASTLARRPRQ